MKVLVFFFLFFMVVININFLLYLVMLLLLVAFLVLLERKILSLLQMRKSPNIVSFLSLLQTILDSVKLLTKNISLSYKNLLFLFCPLLSFFLSLAHWLFMPLPFEFFFNSYTIIITFVLSGLAVYVVMLCSWSSLNNYSKIGAIRAVAQMISYEVAFMFYMMCFMFLLVGYSWKSFLLSKSFIFLGFKFIFVFVFVLLVLSELNRAPFDLVEGESELVSGFNVEYASYGFTFIFLAEYMNIWLMSFIFSLVFSSSLLWCFTFTFFFVNVTLLIRGLLPRFKYVQMMNLLWKVCLPVVFISLFFSLIILS